MRKLFAVGALVVLAGCAGGDDGAGGAAGDQGAIAGSAADVDAGAGFFDWECKCTTVFAGPPSGPITWRSLPNEVCVGNDEAAALGEAASVCANDFGSKALGPCSECSCKRTEARCSEPCVQQPDGSSKGDCL